MIVAYKSRWLVEASYKLSLQEQRFLLLCVGKINPSKPVPESLTITAQEFYCQFPDVGVKNSYVELKKAIDKLWDRSVIVKDPNQTEEFRWIQKRVIYHKGEGRASICFSTDISKYISQLSGQFSKIALNNICNLRSTYSIRLYELCQQFIETGNRLITVESLRELLQLGEAYKEFKTLNRDVISPALKELNDKSNLIVKVAKVKKGRSIHALHFTFTEKKQQQLKGI